MSSLSSAKPYNKSDLVHTFEQFDALFFEFAKFGRLSRRGGELTRWNLERWLKAARIIPDIMSTVDIPLLFALVNGKSVTINRKTLLFFIKAAAIRHKVTEEDMLYRLVSVKTAFDERPKPLPPVFARLSHRSTFTGTTRKDQNRIRPHTMTPLFSFLQALRDKSVEVSWPQSMSRWYVSKRDGCVVKIPDGGQGDCHEEKNGGQALSLRSGTPWSATHSVVTTRSGTLCSGQTSGQPAKCQVFAAY